MAKSSIEVLSQLSGGGRDGTSTKFQTIVLEPTPRPFFLLFLWAETCKGLQMRSQETKSDRAANDLTSQRCEPKFRGESRTARADVLLVLVQLLLEKLSSPRSDARSLSTQKSFFLE